MGDDRFLDEWILWFANGVKLIGIILNNIFLNFYDELEVLVDTENRIPLWWNLSLHEKEP